MAIATASTFAHSTAFTYQGRLNDGAKPAEGSYDLVFSLTDASTSGTGLGAQTNAATVVSNGLFCVSLDFGNQFAGGNRWLEIAVRTNGGSSFTTLIPRQLINPTPYAITAQSLCEPISNALLPSNLVTNGACGVSIAGAFSGNGAGLTNVPGMLSTGQQDSLANTITNLFSTNWNVVVLADSIGAATNSVIGNLVTWPYWFANTPVFNGATLHNYAQSGQGLAYVQNAIPGVMALWSPRVTGKPLAVLIEIGANDFSSFTNVAGANAYFASLDAIYHGLKTNEVTKVYGFTVPMRSDSVNAASLTGTYALNRQILNDTNLDGVVDFASAFPDPSNTNDFADGLHPSLTGSIRLGKLVAATVRGNISTPSSFQNPMNAFIGGGRVQATLISDSGNYVLSGNNLTAGGAIILRTDGNNVIGNPQTGGGSYYVCLDRGFALVIGDGAGGLAGQFNTSGSASLAKGNVTFDATGNLTVRSLSVTATNANPSNVTIGVTTPDAWIAVTNNNTRYLMPAWKNH